MSKKLDEGTWEKAEANQARRERWRLMSIGRLSWRSFPNVMVKDDNGNWKFPRLKANLVAIAQT